jgi:hypothetical protein
VCLICVFRAKYEFDNERVKVVLYGDGMQVDGKGSVKYEDEVATAFINDIMDG